MSQRLEYSANEIGDPRQTLPESLGVGVLTKASSVPPLQRCPLRLQPWTPNSPSLSAIGLPMDEATSGGMPVEQRTEGALPHLPQTSSAMEYQTLKPLLTHLLTVPSQLPPTAVLLSTTQALSKDLSRMQEAQGTAGLLMPPGWQPAQSGKRTDTFFSNKQQ